MSSKKQRTVITRKGTLTETDRCIVYITAKYLFTTLIKGLVPSGVNACQSTLLQVPREISLGAVTTKNGSRDLHVVCIPVKYIYDNYDIPRGSRTLPFVPDSDELIEYNLEKIKRYSIYPEAVYATSDIRDLFIIMSYDDFRAHALEVFADPPTIPQAKIPNIATVLEPVYTSHCAMSGIPMCREMLDMPAHRLHISTLVSTKKNLIHLVDFFTVHKKKSTYFYITKYAIHYALYSHHYRDKSSSCTQPETVSQQEKFETVLQPETVPQPKKLPPLPLYFYPINDTTEHDAQPAEELCTDKFMWKFPLTF